MFCKCGYWATSSITQFITCPICAESLYVLNKADAGRIAWAALHSKRNPTPEWYAEWLDTIPAFDCQCREHWKKITVKLPPDFSSAENFFVWSVKAHNEVNAPIGNARITLDEARQIWRPNG